MNNEFNETVIMSTKYTITILCFGSDERIYIILMTSNTNAIHIFTS